MGLRDTNIPKDPGYSHPAEDILAEDIRYLGEEDSRHHSCGEQQQQQRSEIISLLHFFSDFHTFKLETSNRKNLFIKKPRAKKPRAKTIAPSWQMQAWGSVGAWETKGNKKAVEPRGGMFRTFAAGIADLDCSSLGWPLESEYYCCLG